MALDPIQAAKDAAMAAANDPAIAAIGDLSTAVQASIALVEGEQKAQARNTKAMFEDVSKKLDDAKTELLVGQKVHADRINALDRRSAAIGLHGFRDVEGVCLAALADDERKHIGIIAASMPTHIRSRREDFPILSNPVAATLVASWLHASLRLQKRRFANQQEETQLWGQMERYEKALFDLFPHEKAAAFTSVGGDTLGGAWLPEPVAAELYRLILDNSIMAGQASHVPMTTKTLDLPVEGTSALSVSWGTENVTIVDSVPASNVTDKVVLTANRLNGRAVSSMEQLQDSPISILSWVQTKLVEMAGRAIDQQVLEGTGSPFTGLSNATGVNAMAVATNGDLVTYGSLVDMVFKARERSSRAGAKFFLAPEAMGKIVGLVDTQGQPIVQFGNVPGAFAASILGFPCEVHSVIRADRTYGTGTGGSNIYFGPPSQIVIGDRMGMAWDVSDIPGFSTAEVHMRLIARLAIAVAVPKAFTKHEQYKAV
jgi:HK97 family phage major capsid protein